MRIVFGSGQWRGNTIVSNESFGRDREIGDNARRTTAVVCGPEETDESAGVPSRATGIARRAGVAMRLLLQRHDREGVGTSREDAAANRFPNQDRDEWASLSMRHLSANPQSHPRRCAGDERGDEMSTRREFLKSGGALIIGFSLAENLRGQA